MTEKRPSDLVLEWGLMPKPHGWSRLKAEPREQEQQLEQQREATRLELQPPTPERELEPERGPTIQAPGMGGSFVNTRAQETEAQRKARLDQEQSREPDPWAEAIERGRELREAQDRSPGKIAERIKEVEKDRPGRTFLERELLPPSERDPRR